MIKWIPIISTEGEEEQEEEKDAWFVLTLFSKVITEQEELFF